MHEFNMLDKLLDVQPNEFPFVSVYLNTEPNETGKKDFEIFLKKQLSDHLAVLEPGSPKRESVEAAFKAISDFAESIDPSTRGVALFSRAGEGSYFQAFEFVVPFSESSFHFFDRPYVFPLVHLIAQNPTFAVLSADTNAAHIFVFKRGHTIKREDIANTKTNRTEVGGWSQARYQRHIENFHQQHAKEAIEELEKLVRAEKIDRIVLTGDQAVIVPMLREAMPKELNEKVIASLPLNVNTPEHEIATAAAAAVEEHGKEAEKETTDNLFEVNYDGGTGVAGMEPTLAALLNGQVQELYLSSNPDDIVYRTGDIKVLLKDYAPGLNEDLPDPNEKIFMLDELIRQAARSADKITFIEDPQLLKQVGGVGALLRYQAKGVSNQ